MEENIVGEAIEQLKKLDGPKFFEVYAVHTFWCHRNKNGSTQEVTVRILDRGPSVSNARYASYAIADDGCEAYGDPADTIERALAGVHWRELDLQGNREVSPSDPYEMEEAATRHDATELSASVGA